MNAIRSVFTALANLAASINSLASVLDTAKERLALQLRDDSPPQLAHGSPAGEIVDPERDDAISPKRNGRKTAV